MTYSKILCQEISKTVKVKPHILCVVARLCSTLMPVSKCENEAQELRELTKLILIPNVGYSYNQ